MSEEDGAQKMGFGYFQLNELTNYRYLLYIESKTT